MTNLIVQKYGGATLADPQKIRSVAERISIASKSGQPLLVVVSAMGQTTNELIGLAQQVSKNPSRREMDMLLTVGERISMSLLSMALNDLGVSAISLTGSQAGILTDDSHVSASIQDIKAIRVQEELTKGKVVILAGFQGVSPRTKEITTLGRGGSDTSAVAMAAAFQAKQCEILKDVPAIFTADPKKVQGALPLSELSYDQLLEMTFWGAKVLHYRSVELAKIRSVPLYIGPAQQSQNAQGTWIKKETAMFETAKGLSLNSHETVLEVQILAPYPGESLKKLRTHLEQKQISFPQLLHIESTNNSVHALLTGPKEILQAVALELKETHDIKIVNQNLSSVTLTCTGITSPEISEAVLEKLTTHLIRPDKIIFSAMSMTVILDQSKRDQALASIHQLIV
jgi:aspartate kinase